VLLLLKAVVTLVAAATCQVELQSELSSYGIHTQAVDRYIVTQSRQVRGSSIAQHRPMAAAASLNMPAVQV
jgi:hypothetical protein